MKTTIFIIFCLAIGLSANAQDLLVTTKGDTLNCKITPKTHNPIKIGLSGGWGYRTPKIIAENAEQKDYMKGLRSGFQFSLDFDYYFNNYIGAGMKYSLFKASTSGRVSGNEMKDNTSIQFIGPTFATRFMNASKKNAFIMNLSLGYLGYSDSGEVSGYPGKIIGSTVGTAFDLGYEIGLSRNVALAFQASSVTGTLSKIKISSNGQSETRTLSDDDKENLSRIDLSVGIRFYLGNN